MNALRNTKKMLLIIRNLNYWDSASSLSGEVMNPNKTIPKAYGIALVFVVFTYLIPVMTATGILGSMESEDGYFSHVGQKVIFLSRSACLCRLTLLCTFN